MISRQNELLERSRKSIHYYVHEDQEELSRPGFYSHMLVEDVSSGIMPFRGTKIWETFKVVISPNSSDIENLVILALGEQYHRRALEEVVCDFCRECSQLLMSYGEAIYEISYLIDDEDKKVGFDLNYINPRTLRRRIGKIFQYVPREIAEERQVSEFIELSPNDILIFQAPKYIRNDFPNILSSLKYLDKHQFTGIDVRKFMPESQHSNYDFKLHRYYLQLALAHSFKKIGWNVRQLFEDDMLEYYILHRRLLFEKFKIELRQSILATLNIGLGRAGKQMGFQAIIQIEGLPSLNDVDEMRNKLESGDLNFNDIMYRFSFFP